MTKKLAKQYEVPPADKDVLEFLVIPNPLHMTIHYTLKGLDKRTIERYEVEILLKKEVPLQHALRDLRRQLLEFGKECEGIVEVIVNEQLAKHYERRV